MSINRGDNDMGIGLDSGVSPFGGQVGGGGSGVGGFRQVPLPNGGGHGGTVTMPNIRPWPDSPSQAEFDLLKEKETLMRAASETQLRRIDRLITALKYYANKDDGLFAKQILEEDENG